MLKKAEEEKKKNEEESKQKAEEERKRKEGLRKAEEEKKKREAEQKAEEERKRTEKLRKAEEEKKKKEEEAKQKAEEERRRQEEKKKDEDEKKKKEEAKLKAEERRKQEELQKAEEEKKKSEEKPSSKDSITNTFDYPLRNLLDKADDLLEKEELSAALDQYDSILSKHPSSPRALHGKALVLDRQAEQQQSNTLLEQSIATMEKVLDGKDVPDDLLIMAGKKLAQRQSFRGWNGKAIKTWKFLTEKFPTRLDLKNQLGVSYLVIGKNDEAKEIFKQVLTTDSSNGFAKVHIGFIIKTHDNDASKAIPYLREGVDSGAEGTNDGRFYFHLGDAYQRTNQTSLAHKVYEDGAQKGLFLSKFQRSLYNIDSLTGRPWWTAEQTGYQKYLQILEDNWQLIRDEGMKQLDTKTGSFVPEEENLREKGDWKQFTLYARGKKVEKNCARVPKVCDLIDKIPDAKGCTRGQVKYSVMHPGVHVWPHCGPTNCRIRAHLGLKVPPGPKIRVAEETRQWKEGKIIIFDDSFEHEVWHDGKELRMVLIVDFWHPELTQRQKQTLSPI
ncbi:hypothetical protein FSP39_022013 [Pinctada imbricata]|uniref:Aspartyl/asparaginy/proline hydroxylase domain-containing protein n=1 Tax=Pinctada imbricata TaxID=66713 RepID=A0AA88XVU0_PINIB|nr:hypothetical protein FSP39_022013 [Pinctada imbricata]